MLEALRRAGREDLIGFGRECLVPPRLIRREGKGEKGARPAPGKPASVPRKGGRPKDMPRKTGKPEKPASQKGKPERPPMQRAPKGMPRKGGKPERPSAQKNKRPAKPSPTGKRRG